MSKMKWTREQQSALDLRGRNLLLSASAGSGKTAVLTARIKELLTDEKDPADISDLLILTFTRAAAGEMKTRIASHIAKALSKAQSEGNQFLIRHLSRQTALLSGAQISTLDSFFQSLIHQYFYLIDLDPDTKILNDNNEIDLLMQEVLDEVLEKYYEEGTEEFLDCADLLSRGFQDRGLKDTVLYLYKFSCSMPFPENWLSKLADPYHIPQTKTLSSVPWAAPVMGEYQMLAKGWEDSYRQIFTLLEKEPDLNPYEETLSEEYAAFSFLAQTDSWESWYKGVPQITFERLKSISKSKVSNPMHLEEIKNQIQNIRKNVKTAFKKEIVPFFAVSEEQWINNVRDMYPVVRVLSRLAVDFLQAYNHRKKQERLMEFSDMEHYALDILLDKDNPDFSPEKANEFPSEATLAIRKKYKEIMIDEYQDTNGVQELITELISNGHNRFMVGDIKQSIYAFRQADPSIFFEKYTVFNANDEINCRIDLNRNFRSDKNILSSINYIFRQLLVKKQLGLDYGEEEALFPGRHEEDRPSDYAGGSLSIELIDKNKGDEEENGSASIKDIDSITLEGRLIARRIHSLVEGHKKVMNNDGTFRNIRYDDIVILLRATNGKAPSLLKVFNEENIPAISDKDDDFLQSSEVQVLWSLLKILDNPLQDLPLLSVLRSSFAGLDEKDFAALYSEKREDEDYLWETLQHQQVLSEEKTFRLSRFLDLWSKWRNEADKDGIAPLLRTIFDDSDYISLVSGLPNGAFRKTHIEAFYNLALERDTSTLSGLFPFLEYLRKSRQEFKTAAPAGESNSVRIMSIHKSKGLEFPVVFLADTAKKFNTMDLRNVVVVDKSMGIGIHYLDKKHHVRWPTLYQIALKAKSLKETQAEEARLLYVAMTRARDKLYILATQNDFLKNLQGKLIPLAADEKKKMHPLPGHLTGNGNSFLSWLLPAVARHKTMLPLWGYTNLSPVTVEDAPSDKDTNFTLEITPYKDLLTEEEILGENSSDESDTLSDKEYPVDKFLSLPDIPVPSWLDHQLTWKYDHSGAVNTPAKLTATSAVRLREQEESRAADEEPFASITLAPDVETGDELPSDYADPPEFLRAPSQISGTAYGTLMHKAMELIDLSRIPPEESALREEITALYEKNEFTSDEKDSLLRRSGLHSPIESILQFMTSPLGSAVKNADKVRKELAFSCLFPAAPYYPACEEGEKIFLQGVMDCLLEKDGKLIIIDYKTDHVKTEDELRKHYKVQLLIYKEAAEQILKKPVVGLYIWSFRLNRMIAIDNA